MLAGEGGMRALHKQREARWARFNSGDIRAGWGEAKKKSQC